MEKNVLKLTINYSIHLLYNQNIISILVQSLIRIITLNNLDYVTIRKPSKR
jgi:hypothetical protein